MEGYNPLSIGPAESPAPGAVAPAARTTAFISFDSTDHGMLDKLGALGVVGIVTLLAGIALIAYENLVIAGGLALVLVGLGLTVRSIVTGMLSQFGLF